MFAPGNPANDRFRNRRPLASRLQHRSTAIRSELLFRIPRYLNPGNKQRCSRETWGNSGNLHAGRTRIAL